MSDTPYNEEEEFQTSFNGRTILRILGLTKPHWRWLAGFLAMIIAVALIESVRTYITKQIIDNGILAGNREALAGLALRYGGLVVLQSAGVFGFIYLAGILGERIRYDLRRSMFNHLQNLSLSYFDRTPVGWIMSRVNSDTDRVAELVTWGLLDTTWGVMSIASSMVFMLFINWRLALLVFLIIPLLLIVAAQFQKRILVEYRQVRKLNSKITGSYNESITGVRVIKALGREQGNLDEFGEIAGAMQRSSYRAAWLSALFLPVVEIITAVGIGMIAWYGGWQASQGALTVGGISAFVSYVIFMLWPVQEMARVYAEMQHAIASGERIFSLLDSKPQIVDRPDPVDPGTLRGAISFKDVDFYYDPNKPVLRGFNLEVRQGETIALVGPTGGGKSTIVNLLCRFYEPTSGAISIGGRDYTELSLHGIQSRIGMVLQTPHLFSGSVRENIRYGCLTASDEQVEAAARLAGAHEFIMELENGYDDDVGQGGNLLSVGQKQLISLARAMLAEPDIFIMDEATSSVDTLTEALIQQGMETLMRDRTSFVIAHRLSTIKRADRILVIEQGRIAEMGSHAELIRQRGHYYQLYTRQFRQQLAAEYDPFGGMAPAPAA
ncbi:MAG TPA: ABC transporter ATP-binding protein [Herpetosiphonaceae bacterium]